MKKIINNILWFSIIITAFFIGSFKTSAYTGLSNPATGDTPMNPIIYVVLGVCVVAVIACIVLWFRSRKQNK